MGLISLGLSSASWRFLLTGSHVVAVLLVQSLGHLVPPGLGLERLPYGPEFGHFSTKRAGEMSQAVEERPVYSDVDGEGGQGIAHDCQGLSIGIPEVVLAIAIESTQKCPMRSNNGTEDGERVQIDEGSAQNLVNHETGDGSGKQQVGGNGSLERIQSDWKEMIAQVHIDWKESPQVHVDWKVMNNQMQVLRLLQAAVNKRGLIYTPSHSARTSSELNVPWLAPPLLMWFGTIIPNP